MLAGEIRGQIDRIWDSFWTGDQPRDGHANFTKLVQGRELLAGRNGATASVLPGEAAFEVLVDHHAFERKPTTRRALSLSS